MSGNPPPEGWDESGLRLGLATIDLPPDCHAITCTLVAEGPLIEAWRDHPDSDLQEDLDYLIASYAAIPSAGSDEMRGVQRVGQPAAITRSSTLYLKSGLQHRLDPIVPAEDAASLFAASVPGLASRELSEGAWESRLEIYRLAARAVLGLMPQVVRAVAVEWQPRHLLVHVVFFGGEDSVRSETAAVIRADIRAAIGEAVPGVEIRLGSGWESTHEIIPIRAWPRNSIYV